MDENSIIDKKPLSIRIEDIMEQFQPQVTVRGILSAGATRPDYVYERRLRKDSTFSADCPTNVIDCNIGASEGQELEKN